jgi:hypothetical protein
VVRHVQVLVWRRPVGVVVAHPPQPLPQIQEQRDEEQHRGRDEDDLERSHGYFVAGVVPMNGSGVFGVRYWGSWPFHLLIA